MQKTISSRIDARIKSLKLNEVQVAARAGCSPAAVKKWRANADKMYLMNLLPLCEALECSPAYILGLTAKASV